VLAELCEEKECVVMEKQTQSDPNRAPLAGYRVLETATQNLPISNVRVENKVEEHRLSPGEWLRAVGDFRASFGFERMPDVW